MNDELFVGIKNPYIKLYMFSLRNINRFNNIIIIQLLQITRLWDLFYKKPSLVFSKHPISER